MQDLNKYKQINWVDGMKINKDHFIGLENFFVSRLQEYRNGIVDEFSYGLLPTEGSTDHTIKFIPEVDDLHFKVKLINCHAVTPKGFSVVISDGIQGVEEYNKLNLEASLDLAGAREGEHYLVISVDPFERVSVGGVNSSDEPLRLPFVSPSYKLSLSPVSDRVTNNLEPNLLILGKVRLFNNNPEIVQEYIPPCSSVNSSPQLLEYYNNLSQKLQTLEQNLIELISEINIRESSNILTKTILQIAENLLLYLGMNSTNFRWHMKNKPPVFMVESVITLAKIFKNAFEPRTAEEKEKLLNYFSDHFDINPSKFKQLIDNTIGIKYVHNDIAEALTKAEDYMRVNSILFDELKRMEFILGDRRKPKEKAEPKKKIDIIIR